MSEDTRSKETALCKSCGLCCDGTFFTSTSLDEASETENTTSEAKTENLLAQPCPHFASAEGCGVYGDRPRSCAEFQCRLLNKLREKRVSLDDAMRIVTLAKKQKAEVLDAIDAKATFLKPTPLKTKFESIFFENRYADKQSRKEDARAYLAFGALHHLIRKHFLTDKGKGITVDDSELKKNVS